MVNIRLFTFVIVVYVGCYSITADVFAALRRREFLALNFIRSTKLEFSTSLSLKHEPPAFAKRLLADVFF
jgi:hypothetical protein